MREKLVHSAGGNSDVGDSADQCLYKLGNVRCIYVEGYGGEHYYPTDNLDHSDEIRIRLLEDRISRLERKNT